MINKEIILNADGSIYKDFLDRNIPQYQNNQVSVNVLIPSACFTGLENYAVLLGVSRTISGVETTLNTLIMTASKSITIDDVPYVKYSAILSYSYTDKIATLKVSPYIQTTATTTINNASTEVISIQQSFTNSNLNVIKSVLPQYDASLEEGTIATTLAGQIAAKKFYSYDDTSATSWGQHYYNILLNYNTSTSQYRPALVMSRYDGKNRAYIINGSLLFALIELAEDGLLYKIDNVLYNNNTYTYTRTQISYKQSEVDAKETNLQNQIDDMQDGSVEGSLQDQINDMKDGSLDGSLQKQINTLNSNKVNKTQKINGYTLNNNIVLTKGDVGLGNVANYSVESVEPSASGSQLYITSKAVYDALTSLNTTLQNAIDGKASVSDFNDLDARLDTIEALIGDNDGDDDNIINTLKEVISSLSGLGEDANILSMINSKASQTDFTTLNNQINETNGIKDKVDFLWDRENAYCEIKNLSGTIDILTTDWVDNDDADYPYKWELTNGYLTGATNAIVVFSLDSDTSLISSTVDIDETNGKVIIYASDLPSDTISIEKIAVFNDLNAYINYSNTVVQNNLQNAAAIQEINNVKLPNYIQKNETSGLVKNDGTIDTNTYLTTTDASNTYVPKTNDKGNIINSSNEVGMSIVSSLTDVYGISVKSDGINIGHFSIPFVDTGINITSGNILFTATNLQWKTTRNGTAKTLATTDDLTDYIQKSNTSGLVKNDGTIETNVLTDAQKNLVKDEYNKTLNLVNKNDIHAGYVDSSGNIMPDDSQDPSYKKYYTTIAVKPNTQYTISGMTLYTSNAFHVGFFNGNTFISQIANPATTYTFTTPANCNKIIFDTSYGCWGTTMLNEGSTALAYQSYYGDIIHQVDVVPAILWENAYPNSQLAELTLSDLPSLNQFKYIIFAYKDDNGTDKVVRYEKVEYQSNSGVCLGILPQDTSVQYNISRYIKILSSTSVKINVAYKNKSVDNHYIILTAIYGTNVL